MAGRYLIALGSNVRHVRHGRPRDVVGAAIDALAANGMRIEGASPIMISDPLGPSLRRYANAVLILGTDLDPPALLTRLKVIERDFGRRRGGRRWTSRVLDLDIVLWDGGAWSAPGLTIPHPAYRHRGFVLRPAAQLVPGWRDPVSGLTVRQLLSRLHKPRALTTARRRQGW